MQPNEVSGGNAAVMPGEILSPSQTSCFLNCSAKYRFRYVLGLPDPAGGGAARGKAVHKAIEYYMKATISGITLDAQAIDDYWDEIWDEAAEGALFAANENIEQLNQSGRDLSYKYLSEVAPAIRPAAAELPVTGTISGVAVRGIVDILDVDGRVIDIKTSSRRSSKISGDHALQLATYVALAGEKASGKARIDSLVSTKDPQLVQIEHEPGRRGRQLVETMYPLVAEGIANGLFIPNRASTLCGYCPYKAECASEYGGSPE